MAFCAALDLLKADRNRACFLHRRKERCILIDAAFQFIHAKTLNRLSFRLRDVKGADRLKRHHANLYSFPHRLPILVKDWLSIRIHSFLVPVNRKWRRCEDPDSFFPTLYDPASAS